MYYVVETNGFKHDIWILRGFIKEKSQILKTEQLSCRIEALQLLSDNAKLTDLVTTTWANGGTFSCPFIDLRPSARDLTLSCVLQVQSAAE